MEKEIGKIVHYYNHLEVGIIELVDSLQLGDEIRIAGEKTNFTQKVESMQIEHENVTKAKKGDSVGIKVIDHVHEGNHVYRIEPEEKIMA